MKSSVEDPKLKAILEEVYDNIGLSDDVNSVLRDHNLYDLFDELKTKSAVIRYLVKQGHTRTDIAKALGIRYQHVRNVELKMRQDEAMLNKPKGTE